MSVSGHRNLMRSFIRAPRSDCSETRYGQGRLMVSDFVLRTRGGLSVTEITLSDGRLVRATLHVKSVKVDPKKPGAIDVSYNVIAEIMATPETPISDVHETIR